MNQLFAAGHHAPAPPSSLMDIEQILTLIERIGLPACIIVIMSIFIMKTQQAHREEIIRWEEKDSRGDERLIDVIKEQNRQNATTAEAINGLATAHKDVAKAYDRLALEIKGMAEAMILR